MEQYLYFEMLVHAKPLKTKTNKQKFKKNKYLSYGHKTNIEANASL